jgi:hypothetical protein
MLSSLRRPSAGLHLCLPPDRPTRKAWSTFFIQPVGFQEPVASSPDQMQGTNRAGDLMRCLHHL